MCHCRCPAAHDLGISYYSFDGHNWGFKFKMPKFQGYEQLYLTCDSYVCDYELDGKPYCDRSCNGAGRRRRRRRSLDEVLVNGISLKSHITTNIGVLYNESIIRKQKQNTLNYLKHSLDFHIFTSTMYQVYSLCCFIVGQSRRFKSSSYR